MTGHHRATRPHLLAGLVSRRSIAAPWISACEAPARRWLPWPKTTHREPSRVNSLLFSCEQPLLGWAPRSESGLQHRSALIDLQIFHASRHFTKLKSSRKATFRLRETRAERAENVHDTDSVIDQVRRGLKRNLVQEWPATNASGLCTSEPYFQFRFRNFSQLSSQVRALSWKHQWHSGDHAQVDRQQMR